MFTELDHKKIIELVKQTKELIFREMNHEKVTVKGAADYVTNVDFAVQEFLRSALAQEYPAIPMVAEEKENLGLDYKSELPEKLTLVR